MKPAVKAAVIVFSSSILSCLGFNLVQWEPMEPPHEWRLLWEEVEDCVGAERDFNELRFAKVKHPVFVCGFGNEACVIWPNLVVLGSMQEGIVMHEMVHALWVAGHPQSVFESCGGSSRERRWNAEIEAEDRTVSQRGVD